MKPNMNCAYLLIFTNFNQQYDIYPSILFWQNKRVCVSVLCSSEWRSTVSSSSCQQSKQKFPIPIKWKQVFPTTPQVDLQNSALKAPCMTCALCPCRRDNQRCNTPRCSSLYMCSCSDERGLHVFTVHSADFITISIIIMSLRWRMVIWAQHAGQPARGN